MKALLTNNDQKIEKILIKLIKGKSITERLKNVGALTSLVIRLSKRAIARSNTGKNKCELDLLFVKLHYGEELFEKVKLYLLKYSNEKK